MATRLNGPRAAGKKITVNFEITDTGERCTLYLAHSVLRQDVQAPADDVTLRGFPTQRQRGHSFPSRQVLPPYTVHWQKREP